MRPGFRTLSGRILGVGCLMLHAFAAQARSAEVPHAGPTKQTKRVLVVHSYGRAAPPFTTQSTAFETALTQQTREPVDLDEISLNVARYESLDMEEALVEFVRKRQAQWQPDLVVPMGLPASLFVARYRDLLFPTSTPIIYTGVDPNHFPTSALEKNAVLVGTAFDIPGLVQDIL